MRIFGIDPGLQRTGWGVVDVNGNALRHVAHGVVHTKPDQPTAERLKHIFEELTKMLTLWQPTEAAVEETFVNSNAATSLKLGLARGVALMTPALMNIQVAEYAANLVKKSVVGAGHAEKQQVQAMIRVLLPGIEASPDAADALAVAICHAHHGMTRNKLDSVLSRGAK
jgi:crossover junction endodeoxyribonuclease RuvC